VTTLMMIDSSLGLKSSDCGTSGGRNTWLIRYVTASGLRTTWSGLSPIAAEIWRVAIMRVLKCKEVEVERERKERPGKIRLKAHVCDFSHV